MSRMKRLAAIAVAGGVAASLVGFAGPAEAANQGVFTADGVKIRTGPGPGRTAIDAGYRGQAITVHCHTDGVSPGGTYNNVWFRITKHATNKTGYAHAGGPDERWFTGVAGVPRC